MMNRDDLVTYLDAYLRIAEIPDYGPQGLQVEAGQTMVQRVALAVDVAPPVIDAAAAWGADLLLVHHGVLWGQAARIVGPLGQRVRALLEAGINLYAAHLPLDAHAEVGNNAVLARWLGVEVQKWWCPVHGTPLGTFGPLAAPRPLADFVQLLNCQLHTNARVLAYGPAEVQQVAIVSGAGADEAAQAKALGADTYITGETSHTHYWAAADYGLNIIYAGHYATETVGVRALGDHLATRFGLTMRFFDFPTQM